MKYLNLLAKSKSIDILLGLQSRKLKFAEIVEITGNATTATRRLKEMVELDIVIREVQQDNTRTVMYGLTRDGENIAKIAAELVKLG
jgi:DNA-binding HxlR family transcriptional regulator